MYHTSDITAGLDSGMTDKVISSFVWLAFNRKDSFVHGLRNRETEVRGPPF
jgi:hypothetical protein